MRPQFSYGFSEFDTADHEALRNTSGSTATMTQIAGPLTPASAGEWAILSNISIHGYEPTPGFTVFGGGGYLAIQPLPTTTPILVSNTITEVPGNYGWNANLLLFKGPSYPITATISSVQITSNIVTIVTSAQTFIVGTQVSFTGLVSASFLNGQTLTILSNTGTSITVAFTHANYGPTTETSVTVTNFPYLQSAFNGSMSDPHTTQSLTLPNPVQPGSTILVAVTYSDVNGVCQIDTITDGSNTYTIENQQGTGFINLGFAVNTTLGSRTIGVHTTHTWAASSGVLFTVYELPGIPIAVARGSAFWM